MAEREGHGDAQHASYFMVALCKQEVYPSIEINHQVFTTGTDRLDSVIPSTVEIIVQLHSITSLRVFMSSLAQISKIPRITAMQYGIVMPV